MALSLSCPRGAWRRRLLCGAVLACGGLAAVAAPSPTELARIDRLLTMIATRRDVRMVRNGEEHDAAKAVYFLRRKLDSMGGDIKTCEEFIDRIASRSSTTGQLYWVKLSDGRDMPAGDFLRLELARQDKENKPAR